MTVILNPRITQALALLEKHGFSTDQMNSTFIVLGALKSEQHGSVRDWLVTLDEQDCLEDVLDWLADDAIMALLTKSPYYTEGKQLKKGE